MKLYPYINPDLIYNSFSSEGIIVLEPESVNLLEMNKAGMFICSKFDGSLTEDEVKEDVKKYCTENEISYCDNTIRSFMDSLRESRFLLTTEENKKRDRFEDWEGSFLLEEFNPCLQTISDMSEGFFSKVFIDI